MRLNMWERQHRRALRHCERSEAIQTASGGGILDCFVAPLLAMTAETNLRPLRLPVHVVHHEAHALLRHLDPVAALQRALGVLVAARPVLAHRGARELVILGVALIGLLL